MAYDSANRSERLLQGRRFTTDNLTLTQEAFTDVFDLGAGEIFTDDGLIPSGSSQLAYSGSDQNGLIVSASTVNPNIGDDLPILKFHYRKKLKGAADGQREVYYFTTSDPSTHDDYVSSDQIIEDDQQVNFVSPKYIISSHASRNAESLTPGYKIAISYGNNDNSVTAATDDQFVFDYKTGVLTWVGTPPHDGNDFVFATVYQYVGRTLRSQIDDGSIGGGVSGASVSGSWQSQNFISGSQVVLSSTAQGTLSSSVDGTVTIVDLGLETTDNVTFAGLNVGSTNSGTITIGTNESSTVTIGNSANIVTFAGSASIAGDLIVQGSTTSINTANLNVEDQFLLLNSGSATLKDGGIIVSSGPNNSGSAFYYDSDSNRWALTPKNTTSWDALSETPSQYVVSVDASDSNPGATPLDFGSGNEYYGMMHVNTGSGDIWIYS